MALDFSRDCQPGMPLQNTKTPGFLDYFYLGETSKRFIVSGWQGDLYGSGS